MQACPQGVLVGRDPPNIPFCSVSALLLVGVGPPLQWGPSPLLEDPVTVVGYPLGGDNSSVTQVSSPIASSCPTMMALRPIFRRTLSASPQTWVLSTAKKKKKKRVSLAVAEV